MQARPMPSCGVCLSVRPSVRRLSVNFVDSVETNNFFSPSGSHTILFFFCSKRYDNIPTGTALTGASIDGGSGKKIAILSHRVL